MSLHVTLYQFAKDRSSTKQPINEAVLWEGECVLKERTSVTHPTLLLDFNDGTTTIPWNYAYIPDFRRYYFVTDWTNIRGTLWEVSLSVDVMASYKVQLENQYQFVERASAYNNQDLFDALVIGTNNVTTNRTQEDSPWRSPGGQTWAVEILGNGNSQFYYFYSSGAYNDFISYIFSDEYVDSIFPDWQELYPQVKAQLNPLQYIGSVRKYPVTLPGIIDVGEIYVGYGRVPVNASLGQPAAAVSHNMAITFPRHPQGISFLNNAPYSEYELWYPPFGTIPIDAGLVANNPTIQTMLRIDVNTGQGRLDVFAGSPWHSVGIVTAQIGMNVAISNTVNQGVGSIGLISQGVGMVTAALTGNIPGALNAANNTLQNVVGNLTPKITATGSNTGSAGFSGEVSAMSRFQHVVTPDYQRVGYPAYRHTTPKILGSGYIQCRGAHVEILDAYESEKTEIENIMNGGFYYE